MKNYINQLYQELREELEIYTALSGPPVKRLSGTLSACRQALEKLKIQVKEHPFVRQEDEIRFYKEEKPRFVSEELYALELFNIESHRPVSGRGELRVYYDSELSFIGRFFSLHSFLYQYFTCELKELDQVLFVPGVRPSDLVLSGSYGGDPAFTTAADFLFAKFLAYERLRAFILAELKTLEQPVGVMESGVELVWTGDSINLVELAYGIWLTKQVNKGKASVTEIVEWLEEHLQVNIGTAHRRWVSIAGRKRVSRVKYLDLMREALLRRLDEGEGR